MQKIANQPHLLMIHGLLGSIDYFDPRSYLAGLHVHTPDLLGYGAKASDVPAAAIDLHLQADTIVQMIRERIGAPTWLLGHSVGGAVAMLVAQRAPEMVAGLISVEGNFTLNDAFWCSKVAATELEEWQQQYRNMEADPEGFLTRGAIALNEQRLAWARAILGNQGAATVHSMATSVIRETSGPAYLELVRTVVRRTPIHLLAGERSADGWDVPEWVRTAARSSLVMPGIGHMMMLEDPAGFCRIVRALVEGAPVNPAAAEEVAAEA
jgi:pimeloyl-ACP methyl ester carboxylesterase